tara:strand:+ start:3475 stop:3705 length:231 start_codon:yes stop_codon:yes gene_type:complete
MSSARLLSKQLSKFEARIAVNAKQPKSIVFLSPSVFDSTEDKDDILQIEEVDLEQYKDVPPPTPADQGRYLRDLGI